MHAFQQYARRPCGCGHVRPCDRDHFLFRVQLRKEIRRPLHGASLTEFEDAGRVHYQTTIEALDSV